MGAGDGYGSSGAVAATVGEVDEHGQRLVVGKVTAEQRRTLALGEAGLTAFPYSRRRCDCRSGRRRSGYGGPLAMVGAPGVEAAEAAQVAVHVLHPGGARTVAGHRKTLSDNEVRRSIFQGHHRTIYFRLLPEKLGRKVYPPVSGLALYYGQHCGRENGNTPTGEGAAHQTSGMMVGARYPEGESGQHRAPIVKRFSVREA